MPRWAAAERVRYSAAVAETDKLYTYGFFGISFANADMQFAYLLCGILNSSLTAFQFALGRPTWGLERPTVEAHDLLSLRVPRFAKLDYGRVQTVTGAERAAADAPDSADRLEALDRAVFELYDLEPEERVIAAGGTARALSDLREPQGAEQVRDAA